jgi:hypothetical protein
MIGNKLYTRPKHAVQDKTRQEHRNSSIGIQGAGGMARLKERSVSERVVHKVHERQIKEIDGKGGSGGTMKYEASGQLSGQGNGHSQMAPWSPVLSWGPVDLLGKIGRESFACDRLALAKGGLVKESVVLSWCREARAPIKSNWIAEHVRP